jgi:hypothetical protein
MVMHWQSLLLLQLPLIGEVVAVRRHLLQCH